MKTITKEYQVYSFDELSQEAKDKARNKFNENDDLPFLQDNLREYIHEELKERGFEVVGVSTSEKPSIRPLYSLSYCQGDGLMFEATVREIKTGNEYTIKHSGHYYHERSTSISGQDKDGEEIETKDFEEQTYIPICKKVARQGYDEIEYQGSEECFRDTCEANDYNFLSDGKMVNY
jgi:hypothetical protein